MHCLTKLDLVELFLWPVTGAASEIKRCLFMSPQKRSHDYQTIEINDLLTKHYLGQAGLAHAFNPSTSQSDLCEFEGSTE